MRLECRVCGEAHHESGRLTLFFFLFFFFFFFLFVFLQLTRFESVSRGVARLLYGISGKFKRRTKVDELCGEPQELGTLLRPAHAELLHLAATRPTLVGWLLWRFRASEARARGESASRILDGGIPSGESLPVFLGPGHWSPALGASGIPTLAHCLVPREVFLGKS
ncbi:hypothetical protein BD289DRAFT_78782 [Coniella lustricola]|uniref:Uncharacterized protein n=1 Tax=Coniella lustricola TaxID=2025994 RepID=A0A2T2ZZ84_9PEZI|nr:hypothetical protein BD289DRAFT_78782 [Coniella lustricola]